MFTALTLGIAGGYVVASQDRWSLKFTPAFRGKPEPVMVTVVVLAGPLVGLTPVTTRGAGPS